MLKRFYGTLQKQRVTIVREKLCVLRVITSIIYDYNNNLCQASTLSSGDYKD